MEALDQEINEVLVQVCFTGGAWIHTGLVSLGPVI